MFIVDSKNINIRAAYDHQLQRKTYLLTYQNITYQIYTRFALDSQKEAQNAWRVLTDERNLVCLLVREPTYYSLWIKSNNNRNRINTNVNFLTRTIIWILQGLCLEIEDLLGKSNSNSFLNEITRLNTNLFKRFKIKELIKINLANDKTIPNFSEEELWQLRQSIYQISYQLLGIEYADQTIKEIIEELPKEMQNNYLQWENNKDTH